MNEPPQELWEAIYQKHRRALFAIAYSILGCEQLAEDAIHEAFLAIYRAKQRPQDAESYAFSCVRNSAIDTSRRAKRLRQVHESIFNGYAPPAASGSATNPPSLLDQERDQLLRHAIDRLAPDQREVVILRAFAELTFDQIAEVTSSSAKTVASRYRRALDKLGEHLKGKL